MLLVGSVAVTLFCAHHVSSGRNGGFLSAASCTSFVELQEEYGTNEALRGLLLEHHSYNFTIDVLERHGLLNEASILFGDSIHLFEAEDEYASNKADCDAAKAAGMDMTGINWWTADYVAKVQLSSFLMIVLISDAHLSTAIQYIFVWRLYQSICGDLASEGCNPNVSSG